MNQEFKPFVQQKRQLLLFLSAPLMFFLLIFSQGAWSEDAILGEIAETLGVLLVFACIIGRCWSILYIGDKKNTNLVNNGPYAYTRNPLYFFSALGMMGIGFLVGSFILGFVFFGFTYLAFLYVMKRESEALSHYFGTEYEEYKERVPQFLPNPFVKIPDDMDTDTIVVSTKALKRTFLDASLFLLIIPLREWLEYLHENGSVVTQLFLY